MEKLVALSIHPVVNYPRHHNVRWVYRQLAAMLGLSFGMRCVAKRRGLPPGQGQSVEKQGRNLVSQIFRRVQWTSFDV
jgi:hypothetical protein